MPNATFGMGRTFLLVVAFATLGCMALLALRIEPSLPLVFVAPTGVIVLPVPTAFSFQRRAPRSGWDTLLALTVSVIEVLAGASLLVAISRSPDGRDWVLAPGAVFFLLTGLMVVLTWNSAADTLATVAKRRRWTAYTFATEVLAVVSLLLGPSFTPHEGPSRVLRAQSDVANIGKAVARVRSDTGNTSAACLTNITANLPGVTPPETCGGKTLPLCTTATPGYVCWGGPYIPTVTNDPWNHPYAATLDLETFSVTITSLGRDGVPSNDDVTFIQ